MQDRLTGDEVRAIRTGMNMGAMDFALMFGVTVRTVEFWESGVVVPSRLTSLVIKAESAKRVKLAAENARAAAERTLGARSPRVSRPRETRAAAKSRRSQS